MISDDEYKIFTRPLNNLSPSRLNEILTLCEEFTDALKKDPSYKHLLAEDGLTKMLLATQYCAYGTSDPARMWLSTLKTVARSCDFHLVSTQFALFVISQERNDYRIQDDQLRLVVTYAHIKVIANIMDDSI